MKAFATLIAGAALAASTAALAAPPTTRTAPSGEAYDGSQVDTTFVSTKTRAEVRAEAIAALRKGEILTGELYPLDFASPMRSGKTRAEVKAELALAIKNGELRQEQ